MVKDANGLRFSLDGGRGSLQGDRPLTVKKIFQGERPGCGGGSVGVWAAELAEMEREGDSGGGRLTGVGGPLCSGAAPSPSLPCGSQHLCHRGAWLYRPSSPTGERTQGQSHPLQAEKSPRLPGSPCSVSLPMVPGACFITLAACGPSAVPKTTCQQPLDPGPRVQARHPGVSCRGP